VDIIEAIRTRKSIRAFKPDPVPKEVLEELLNTCRWAPSWANTQCWEFAVVGGKVLDELKSQLEEKARMQAHHTPDVPKPNIIEPYYSRMTKVWEDLEESQFPPGTERAEEKRYEYLLKVARFNDAPNGIIICIDRTLGYYLVHDVGMIVQTICLAALSYGLGTCISVRVVFHPEVLREVLKIPDTKLIVMGIDIGYPDLEAPVNNIARSREPLKNLVHWYSI